MSEAVHALDGALEQPSELVRDSSEDRGIEFTGARLELRRTSFDVAKLSEQIVPRGWRTSGRSHDDGRDDEQ
jgi:hypothetical protein